MILGNPVAIEGIGPVIEQFDISKLSSFVRFVTEDGKSPVKRLYDRDKDLRLVELPKIFGMLPVRLLDEISNSTSCTRFEIVEGSGPLKLFGKSRKVVGFVRSPIVGGMFPEK